MSLKKFGEKIKILRTAKNYTQERIADVLKVILQKIITFNIKLTLMYNVKANFVFLFSLLSLAMFSCRPSETDQMLPQESEAVIRGLQGTAVAYDKNKVRQFSALSFNSKKLAYKSLSKEEKFAFWTTHITNHINSKKLSQTQKGLLLEGLKKLSPEVYNLDSEANKVFKTFIDGEWSKRVTNSFTKNQVQGVLMLMDEVAPDPDEVYGGRCGCGMSSWIIDDCNESNCYPFACLTNYDNSCGAWWLAACDGMCARRARSI